MKSLRIIILVLCASSLAVAGDPEFKGIVHSIEHTYGVHHMRIPLLGVAMFFTRPSGVHGLKLAIFEGFKPPMESEDVSRVVESSLGSGWYPFVRVRTKGKTDAETTLIYTSPSGNKMRMMIVSLEPSEAVVVKLELSEHAIEKWLKEPGEGVNHHSQGPKHDKSDKQENNGRHDDDQAKLAETSRSDRSAVILPAVAGLLGPAAPPMIPLTQGPLKR